MNLEITRHDLKILSVCYFIQAAVIGFSGLFLLGYAALFGTILSTIPQNSGREAIPANVATIAGGVLGLFALLTILLAIATFLCGRYIKEGQHRGLCLVVAALTCLAFPYGTILGVFTFLVLGRPEAKELAGMAPPQPPALPVL